MLTVNLFPNFSEWILAISAKIGLALTINIEKSNNCEL